MKNLHITVLDKIATFLQRDGEIVCGNSDYKIIFVFDDEWNGVAKTARFLWNGEKRDVPIRSDNTCTVPIINDTDKVVVGIFSDDISTTPVIIPCKRSILCSP